MIHINFKRNVLLEKHNEGKCLEEYFVSLLRGSKIKINPKYPDVIIFYKAKQHLFKHYITERTFVFYGKVWTLFAGEFGNNFHNFKDIEKNIDNIISRYSDSYSILTITSTYCN